MTSARSIATARCVLAILFTVSGALMLGMTIVASMQSAVWNVDPLVLADRWFQATLLDAYLAFATFYVWVFYKEPSWAGRVVWLLLIMSLGSMAMAGYVLLQLWRWNVQDGMSGLLLRRGTTAS